MRFSTTLTALAAAVAVNASQQAPAPPAYDSGMTTSASTTYTITRTVSRVVQTVTATRNGTLSTYESTTMVATTIASAAPTAPGYGNATLPGTGAPSASATSTVPVYEGGAGKAEAAGLAAIMGIIGMLAL